MCYPKPGPRCTQHARQRLKKAQREHVSAQAVMSEAATEHRVAQRFGGDTLKAGSALDNARGAEFDKGAAVHEAQRQFDATKGGIAELERQFEGSPGDVRLLSRLDSAKRQFEDAKQAYAHVQSLAQRMGDAKRMGIVDRGPLPAELRQPQMSRDAVSSGMKDLRDRLAGPDAEPEAAADYYGDVAAKRASALAFGFSGSRRWSANNRMTLAVQERAAGETHDGFYASGGQWKEMGREVRPDAKPLTVWTTVRSGSGGSSRELAGVDAAQGSGQRVTVVASLRAQGRYRRADAMEQQSGRRTHRECRVYDLSHTQAVGLDAGAPRPAVTQDAFEASVARHTAGMPQSQAGLTRYLAARGLRYDAPGSRAAAISAVSPQSTGAAALQGTRARMSALEGRVSPAMRSAESVMADFFGR